MILYDHIFFYYIIFYHNITYHIISYHIISYRKLIFKSSNQDGLHGEEPLHGGDVGPRQLARRNARSQYRHQCHAGGDQLDHHLEAFLHQDLRMESNIHIYNIIYAYIYMSM